jgi:hypothetical protein
MSTGRYLGQRQKWFALRFKGRDRDVRLDLHTPEFSEWRWARLEETPDLVIPFKQPVYREVVRRFRRHAAGEPLGARAARDGAGGRNDGSGPPDKGGAKS